MFTFILDFITSLPYIMLGVFGFALLVFIITKVSASSKAKKYAELQRIAAEKERAEEAKREQAREARKWPSIPEGGTVFSVHVSVPPQLEDGSELFRVFTEHVSLDGYEPCEGVRVPTGEWLDLSRERWHEDNPNCVAVSYDGDKLGTLPSGAVSDTICQYYDKPDYKCFAVCKYIREDQDTAAVVPVIYFIPPKKRKAPVEVDEE